MTGEILTYKLAKIQGTEDIQWHNRDEINKIQTVRNSKGQMVQFFQQKTIKKFGKRNKKKEEIDIDKQDSEIVSEIAK